MELKNNWNIKSQHKNMFFFRSVDICCARTCYRLIEINFFKNYLEAFI